MVLRFSCSGGVPEGAWEKKGKVKRNLAIFKIVGVQEVIYGVQESPSDLWCNLVTLDVEGACNHFGLYRYMWNNVNIK